MDAPYTPHDDARQLLVGTPPVAGLLAVDEGIALLEDVDPRRAFEVGRTQMRFAWTAAEAALTPLGVEVATPQDPERRGQHLALRHPDAGALVDRLAEDGVIVDHRTPDVIRLAASPLHTRFVDLWTAIDALRRYLAP